MVVLGSLLPAFGVHGFYIGLYWFFTTIFILFNDRIFSKRRSGEPYNAVDKGRIIEMEFSNRHHHKPLVNAVVLYRGVKKKFEYLDWNFELNFDVGDYVVVRYVSSDVLDSEIDVELSKKVKGYGMSIDDLIENERDSLASGPLTLGLASQQDIETADNKTSLASFVVTSVTLVSIEGKASFHVCGAVQGGDFDGREAEFYADREDVNRVQLTAGDTLEVSVGWTSSGLQVNVLSFE